jgi:hypothetical protein
VKLKYRSIHFKRIGEDKEKWYCFSNGTGKWFGSIFWYKVWRKFVYEPAPNMKPMYSDNTLKDIIDFMGQLREAKEKEEEEWQRSKLSS